jgi:hypothetical protein
MKLFLLLSILFLAACGAPIETVKPVEVRTIEISRPAPIVPAVDQLQLRPVSWIIITPNNIDEAFAKIQRGELVLFAVTAEGYQNIALNLSDIRALIEQQNRIIAVYKSQYK